MRKLTIAIAAAVLGLGLANCGGESPSHGSSFAPGTVLQNPDPNIDTYFVVETNQGGDAASMHIRRTVWGRLVDIYMQGESQPRFVDFLIGDDIESDGFDFELVRNPVTSKDELTILHAFGSPGFKIAFARLEVGLQPFLIKSLDPSQLPPFTAVPRNAAVAIVFDDLLSDGGDPVDATYPGSVTSANVRLAVGYPPQAGFEARIFPDPNHGDISSGQFHSTRVIVDMTVSQYESGAGGLTLNGLGLPEAVNTSQANVAVRLPSRVSVGAGQFSVLTNLDGNPVAFNGNGATDPTVPTLDVVRAFRSGGRTSVTNDLFNGFLRDTTQPTIVGSQTVQLTAVGAISANEYLVSYQYFVSSCAVLPRKGTVLNLGQVVLQATQDGFAPIAGLVSNLPTKVINGDPSLPPTLINGLGELRVAWDLALGAAPECFIKISPTAGSPPATLVSTTASIEVRFSEPVDPESVRAFDTLAINYSPAPANPLLRRVAGTITPSLDLTAFTLAPSLPLNHAAGGSEAYTLTIATGTTGITDLAGNPLATPLATAGGNPPRFTLDPSQAALTTGSLGLTFNTTDEDGNTFNDLRGQLNYDLLRGRIGPRSVTRFSGIVDASEPSISLLLSGGGGPAQARVPLTRYGARVQTLWRYHDMGLTLLDVAPSVPPAPPTPAIFSDATFNIDVEGLSWTPAVSALLLDNYPRFQMALSHSKFLPDEFINVQFQTPKYPDSGLTTDFADNVLDAVEDPLTVVHPAGNGYVIQPLDVFTTTSGSRMTPWPLNREAALADFTYWTWRDTGKVSLAAPNNNGADYSLVFAVDPNAFLAYAADNVPTIALPLLMEFRNYPVTSAGLFNPLAGVLASPPLSLTQFENQPFFTAYSAGGVNTSTGVIVNLEPDAALVATGTIPPGGPNNLPRNQFIYFGQADFVTRVNRIHTVWLDTGASNNFAPAAFEPTASAIPAGTQISFAYRGATGLTGNATVYGNAVNYDPYGNPSIVATFGPVFTNGDANWKTDITEIDGSRFVQVRITMGSNPESGVTPNLTSFGFGFYR